MKHVTAEDFESVVLKSEKPVLVDFWAVWCGPCRMLAPVLEELEQEKPELVIAKVDVDEEMELAMRYQVASIPTLILFKNGKIAGRIMGYLPKEKLCEELGI